MYLEKLFNLLSTNTFAWSAFFIIGVGIWMYALREPKKTVKKKRKSNGKKDKFKTKKT